MHTHNTTQKDKIHQIGHKLSLRKFTVTIAGPSFMECITHLLMRIT